MSFRIDLITKEDVTVFLVVVRDQINVFFASKNRDKAYEVRNNFIHLGEHFELRDEISIVRGSDPEHVKRHHIINEETTIPHVHTGFNQDVTPELLTQYLTGILAGQKAHSQESKFQFLNQQQVNEVLATYKEFYQDFTGSRLQQRFLAERKLTLSEKKSLAAQAKTDSGELSQADRNELTESGIDIPQKTTNAGKEFHTFDDLLKFMMMGGNARNISNTIQEPPQFSLSLSH